VPGLVGGVGGAGIVEIVVQGTQAVNDLLRQIFRRQGRRPSFPRPLRIGILSGWHRSPFVVEEAPMHRGMLILALTALILLASTPTARTGGKGKNPIVEAAREKVADPKKPFTIVVFLTVKKDQGAKLEEAFQPAIKASRKEAGCLAYDLNRDNTDPSKYYVYERWKSLAALEEHLESEPIKTLLTKVPDLLVSPPEAKFFSIVGE
jgi:quinol monooxygenase YgiN